MRPTKVLTVDPGVQGTGLAIWEAKDWRKAVPPLWCGNITPGKGPGDWLERVWRITAKLEGLLEDHGEGRGIGCVYMEYPGYFQGSSKGQAAAESGDLVKLCYIVGAYGECFRRAGIPLTLVPVEAWKGQMSKEVVKQRILKRIPGVRDLRPTTHSWDAIGIGLAMKGQLTVRLPVREEHSCELGITEAAEGTGVGAAVGSGRGPKAGLGTLHPLPTWPDCVSARHL